MNLSIPANKGAGPMIRMVIICLIGLALFIGFAVYPSHKKSLALDERILQLQAQVERQKVLNPVFGQVRALLDKTGHEDTEVLPMPEAIELAQPEIHGIQAVLNDIINESGLRTDVIKPEVNTLIDNTHRMRVYTAATGGFETFRGLLLNLGNRLPSLSHIERIDINRIEGSSSLKLEMVLWLAKTG